MTTTTTKSLKVPTPNDILTDDRLIWDSWLTVHKLPALWAAEQVGVFKALSQQALTTEALAAKTETVVRALSVVLGYLASFGLLEKHAGLWRTTPVASTYLDRSRAAFWGPLLAGFVDGLPLHVRISDLLKKGYAELPPRAGVKEWERGAMDPEVAVRMAAFMNAHSVYSAQSAARASLFTDVKSVMDVGAGSGIFSIALAKTWPQLSATLMEIEAMCSAAQPYIEAASLSDRVRTQHVDMFRQAWPSGHDAHFFSNIFHDWSEDTNLMLAHKSFEALAPGGQIILHEMLVDDDGCGPETTLSFSILMLLGTRGRQYTFAELRNFLEAAGFVDIKATRTGSSYYSLVTGRKP
jgi:3-hydroxy-5-methyl-1-naphthoate 3-O-methyltransferase